MHMPPTIAESEVCDEIISIMEEYDRQESASGVDTPGGLEHMGDVWRLLRRWSNVLQVGRQVAP
jgi:hypothetical protein